MKKKRTIGIKINIFLVLMILLVAAVITTISYFINASHVDSHFARINISLCKTMVNLVDRDFVDDLADKVKTEEYQKIRSEAVEAEDDTGIIEWLKKEGLYDKYTATIASMADLQKDMEDVEYIYFWTCVGHNSYALMDPREDNFYLGYFYANEDEFEQYTTNCHIDPTINYSDEYGWLMSGYEPVLDSEGKARASIGVDINMDTVMAERNRFLWTMIAISGGLILLTIIVGIIMARQIIVRPLTILSVDMGKFSPVAEADYDTCNVLNVTYKKNNEIGTLYSGIHDMQTNIVDYLGDITKVTAEKERISAELDVAARMQAGIVPTDFPERDDIKLYATMTPAKEMGGDFYDYFMIDDDHMGLVMADVSGKGVPAAMFMIAAKTVLKHRAMTGGKPSEILYDVNNALCADNPSGLFVTVWFGILTLSTGSLIVSNAGHEYPAIRHGDQDYAVRDPGENMPPLATMEDLDYEDEEIQLSEGDCLFLYTDGVPEAKGGDNTRFGMDRMLVVLNRDKDMSPEEMLISMKNEIDSFAANAEPFDDITMMSIRYKKGVSQ